jgi:hypothetical protein
VLLARDDADDARALLRAVRGALDLAVFEVALVVLAAVVPAALLLDAAFVDFVVSALVLPLAALELEAAFAVLDFGADLLLALVVAARLAAGISDS